jgi:hypothetical protein
VGSIDGQVGIHRRVDRILWDVRDRRIGGIDLILLHGDRVEANMLDRIQSGRVPVEPISRTARSMTSSMCSGVTSSA